MADRQALRRHWWVAALLGFVGAGLGQVYVGQLGLGLLFAAVWLAGTVLLASDLLQTFGGLVATFGSVFALHVVTLGLAAFHAWRQPNIPRQWVHRWYVYPLYVVAIGLISLIIDIVGFSAFGVVPWMDRYKPSRIVSVSMEPTLLSGDYFMTERVSPDFPARVERQVGDIVLYRPATREETYVHRLVAVGGDEIGMHEGNLIVNGQVLPRTPLCADPGASREDGFDTQLSAEENRGRKYAVQHTTSTDPGGVMRESEVKMLPAEYFFVVGDARDNSSDSRFQGPLRDDEFVGRALYIIWSSDWSRIGRSIVPDRHIVRSDYCDEVRGP
jgi:signal peptidase I